MRQPVWASVNREVGFKPRAERQFGGGPPLFIRHWVPKTKSIELSPVPRPVPLTRLGWGSRVREGHEGGWRLSALPDQSLLMPPDIPTNRHDTGAVEDLAIYLPEPRHGIQRRLADPVISHAEPMPFADALVGGAAQELANELDVGAAADESFMTQLAHLMLEQVFRVPTGSNASTIPPRHAHHERPRRVMRHLHAHLADERSIAGLAALAMTSKVGDALAVAAAPAAAVAARSIRQQPPPPQNRPAVRPSAPCPPGCAATR